MWRPIFDRREAVAVSLNGFVSRICRDVVFRRAVRYRPAEALAGCGFEPERSPASLPVRHYEVSVDCSVPVLFGTAEPSADNPPLPLEVRLVLYGLKPMALIQAPAAQAAALVAQCAQFGLSAILSSYEYTPIADAAAGGYVNVAGGRRPAGPQLAGWRTVVIARDSHQVQLGWLSLLFGWDEFLGLLLGYPACCVAAFPAHWREACLNHKGEVATVLLGAAVTPERPVIEAGHCCMNLFARYFGFHLTEHFPCSFQCEATRHLGQRLLEGLTQFEPDRAAEIARMLSAPVVFANDDGAYLFPGGRWDETRGALRYSEVLMSNSRAARSGRIASAREWRLGDGGALMRFPALTA